MPKIIKVYNGTQRLDDVAVRRPRYSKPQGSSNQSYPIEPLLNQASDKNDLGLEQFDFNFNDDYGEYNELPITYFEFESEYDYIFQSINPHIKYMVGDARDSNQILFMQDFEFDQNTNQFTFKSVIVSVALVNVRSLTNWFIYCNGLQLQQLLHPSGSWNMFTCR